MHIDLFKKIAKPLALAATLTTTTEIGKKRTILVKGTYFSNNDFPFNFRLILDPVIIMQKRLHQVLYGNKIQES